jgi:TonB family protein
MKKMLRSFRLAGCLVLGAVTVLAQKVPPKVITHPLPGYPNELTNTGQDGVAEVDVLIKADGSVGNPRLGMATHRAFGKAAMAVITTWQFQPATVGGAPVDMEVTVPFHFVPPVDQVINAIAKRVVFVDLPQPPVSEKDFPAKKLKVTKAAKPVIPPALAGTGLDEKVQVKFVIAPDGSTLNPIALDAKHKELEGLAVVAVALMSFAPCLVDGKPAYVEATTTVQFTSPPRGSGGSGNDK